MSFIFVEFGINPENSGETSEPSIETRELVERYSTEMVFVARLFTRFLSDWHPKDLRKITIYIVDSNKKEGTSSANWLTKVCLIYKYFEWTSFNKEENQINRYKILLDFMSKTLTEASKQFGWPVEIFTEAYSKVIVSNFINEYLLVAPKSSPDKKHSASLSVRVDKDYSTIFLEVKDTGGQIQKGVLTKVAQQQDEFLSIVKNIKWVDNNLLVISNKDNEINFKCSLENQTVEIFLTPNIHDERYLQDELKLIDPNTSKEEGLEIRSKRIEYMKNMYNK